MQRGLPAKAREQAGVGSALGYMYLNKMCVHIYIYIYIVRSNLFDLIDASLSHRCISYKYIYIYMSEPPCMHVCFQARLNYELTVRGVWKVTCT